MAETRTARCACGAQFEIQVGKRGRPPTRCAECQAAKADGTLRDRLTQLAPGWISQELGMSAEELTEKTRTAQVKKTEETAESKKKAEEAVDHLEMMLKSRGQHISQHPER